MKFFNLSEGRQAFWLVGLLVVTAGVTAGVVAVLVGIFEHKQEARTPFVQLAEVSEISTDPVPWGKNFPRHFDGWKATAGDKFYGGSSALPDSKLDHFPWLKRLYAGYAFSIDYREARGHAYMLYDQGVTERVTQKPQAGACLHCHASGTVMYRKAGLEAMGKPADDAALAREFNMDAVIRGFQEVSQKPYSEVLAMVQAAPDGTPGDEGNPVFPQAPTGGFTGEFAGKKVPEGHMVAGDAHPVSCIDCHDPKTMATRVTRPGFVFGIQALAESDAATPHLPSIEAWRRTDRSKPYDPNVDATRQEMRSYVCGQCHVEYYCATKAVLEFPWGKGLKMEDLEAHWEATKFADGSDFIDYKHKETGATIYKVQHPEFELWSQGVHARSGVSCSDCHMPYQKQGAMKISSHNVQSPLDDINNACQQCHNVPEAELREKVETTQSRTMAHMDRAAKAMIDMLDAILEAKAAGATAEQLAPVLDLQRKSMWRLDYISSENSRGFHAPQESVRILGESIDYSRQAEAMAVRIRAGDAPKLAAEKGDGVDVATKEKPEDKPEGV